MNATTLDDGAAAAAALATKEPCTIVITSAASAPRLSLFTIFIVLAIVMCFLVEPYFAVPVSTSTTESTSKTISQSPKSVKRRHQNHLQRRSDFSAAEMCTIIFCCIGGVGLLWLLVSLVLTWVFKRLGRGSTRTRQEGKHQQITATTNEEVSDDIVRGLRRDNDETSRKRRDNGCQSWHEQPDSGIAHLEMQRTREMELRLSSGMPPVRLVAKPPAYKSEEELPPYATTSRADQVPGYSDTVIEMPQMAFPRIN
jgi:hypothetical protein